MKGGRVNEMRSSSSRHGPFDDHDGVETWTELDRTSFNQETTSDPESIYLSYALADIKVNSCAAAKLDITRKPVQILEVLNFVQQSDISQSGPFLQVLSDLESKSLFLR
jgi:hypothetical protein